MPSFTLITLCYYFSGIIAISENICYNTWNFFIFRNASPSQMSRGHCRQLLHHRTALRTWWESTHLRASHCRALLRLSSSCSPPQGIRSPWPEGMCPPKEHFPLLIQVPGAGVFPVQSASRLPPGPTWGSPSSFLRRVLGSRSKHRAEDWPGGRYSEGPCVHGSWAWRLRCSQEAPHSEKEQGRRRERGGGWLFPTPCSPHKELQESKDSKFKQPTKTLCS